MWRTAKIEGLTLKYASLGNREEEDPAMETVKEQPVSQERNQEMMML